MVQEPPLNSSIESSSKESANLLFEVQSLIDSYPQGRYSFPTYLDFNMYILQQAKFAADSEKPVELLVDGTRKSLVKMRLLEFIDSESPNFKGYLVLSFKDKTKYAIPLNSANCLVLKELFKVQGCNLDPIYSRKSARAVDWIKSNVDTVYDSYASRRAKVDEFYDAEHLKIINEIRRILAKEPALKTINIIDGGCGNGKYINAAANAFHEIDAHLAGFDFNESNIEHAQSKYSDKGTFIRGNLMNFQEVLDQCAHVLDKNAPTFMVLSGSLTRLVLSDGFQALKVLQGFANSDFADYLVGCGVGEPLINRHIAKQVGYRMEPSATTASELFSCKKMTQEEFIEQKLKKLKQYNTLDLSLYHNPTSLLLNQQLLKHLANDSIIDLSFTTLTPELIDTIKLIIKEKPKVKLVFWHNQIDQLQEFYDLFPEENIKSLYYTRDEHVLGTSLWLNSTFEPDLSDLSGYSVSSKFSNFYIKNLLLNSKNERSVLLNLIHLSEQSGLRNWVFDNTNFLEQIRNEKFHNISAQQRDELINSAVKAINSSNFELVIYILEKLNLINSTTDPELYYLLNVYKQVGYESEIFGSDLICKTISSTKNREDRIIQSLKFYNRDFEDNYRNLIKLVKNISLETPNEVHNSLEELVFWAIKNWSNFEDVEQLIKILEESKLIDPQRDLIIYYMLAFFKQNPDRRTDISGEATLNNEKGRLIEALKFYDETLHDMYLQMVSMLVANQWQKEFDFLAMQGHHERLIKALSHSHYPELKILELLPYLSADSSIVFSYNWSSNSLEIKSQFDSWDVHAKAELDVKLQRLGFTDTAIADIINPFNISSGVSNLLRIALNDQQIQLVIADLDNIKARPEKNILESAFYQPLLELNPEEEFDDPEQPGFLKLAPTFFGSSQKTNPYDDRSIDDYALLGLTREQAHSLLIQNIQDIQEFLTPLINEKLLDKQFLEYLNTKQLSPPDSPLNNLTSQASQFAPTPEIIQGYIDYEIHDRKSNTSRIEPILFKILQDLITKTPKLG